MEGYQDSLSLSGLEYYRLQDYGRMVLRRKWFIIITTLAVAVATAIVACFIPNSFRATTVILVDPQKIPDYYVNSTVTSTVIDRLATLRQEILSDSRLSQIIEEMGLYKDSKNKQSMEEYVKLMQKDITVDLAATTHGEKALGAFTISYVNRSPIIAAQVTNRLASLFIDENIKNREQSVEGTADFLAKELDDAQKDLKEKEDQITVLKTKNVGELPESEATQVQTLNTLQIELQSERDALNQAQQQKLYLQSMLGDVPSVVNLDTEQSPEVLAMQTELSQRENEVDQLRKRYGPQYPDVIKQNTEIQDLQRRIAETQKEQAANQPKIKPTPSKSHNPIVESQLARIDEDVQKHQQRAKDIEGQIAAHQAQLERIPLFQQQISSVMREYQAAQDHYKYLHDRKFSADMAADLEVRQKGERFEVLDPAQVPFAPDTPNRPLINLIGLAGGLVFGFVGALGLEILDPSVKTEREVVAQLGSVVFGEVPSLQTKASKRRQVVRTIMAFGSSAALAAVYSIILVATWR
jgi:polysaccharide chain length determinant protein (PEP-CTERM system associated)